MRIRGGVLSITAVGACVALSMGLAGADELLTTPTVLACAKKVYEEGLFAGLNGGEAGAAVYVDAEGGPRCHTLARSMAGGAVDVKIRPGTVAILHTHPPKTQPCPSRDDAALAGRLGISVYTLQPDAIWRVDQAGVITQEAGREWMRAPSNDLASGGLTGSRPRP